MDQKKQTISETPEEFGAMHKTLMGIASFFFVYLIIEAILLIPALFLRYGVH